MELLADWYKPGDRGVGLLPLAFYVTTSARDHRQKRIGQRRRRVYTHRLKAALVFGFTLAIERIDVARRWLLLIVSALLILSVLAFGEICSCLHCTCSGCNGQCARKAMTSDAMAAMPMAPPPCATKLQSSMLCVVPQVYGVGGLTLPNVHHAAHFTSSQTNFQIPLSVSVGTELSLVSAASPASGVLFTYDPTLHTFVPSTTESYGPVLTERAETIGKHRIFVAVTYQFLDFSSLDGIDLHHLPVAYSHAPFQVSACVSNPSDPQCDPSRPGFPAFEQEYITTQNRIDLKAHQITLSGTFGLTNRIDISVDVPILDIGLGITSAAHIVRAAPQPVASNDALFGTTVNGFYHFFNANDPAGSLDEVVSNSNRANGIGDVVFRVKGTVLKYERTRVALGLDIRTPTGDAQNFLGSGAIGLKPFIAASYAGRVSPHVNLGYEYNGDSIIAGNLGTGSLGKLANQFFYSGGVDIAVARRLTLAADVLGDRLSSSGRLQPTSFANVDGVTQPGVQQVTLFQGPVNMVDISTGAKVNLFRNLLLTANVAFKANEAGLRAKAVPLGAISYSF